MIETYVMPGPKVKIESGRFSFGGKAVPVSVNGNVLDYLKAAGVYNLEADVYNGPVDFDCNFSIHERLGEVDEALAVVDRKRMEKDLDAKGYAFLMVKEKSGRFEDYQNKGFMANMDRIVQDLAYQKLSNELGFDVRHLKLQEGIELMGSDKAFKAIANDYWMPNLEVIQILAEQPVSGYKLVGGELQTLPPGLEILTPVEISSVGLDCGGDHPYADAFRPLHRNGGNVAALKKVDPRKVA